MGRGGQGDRRDEARQASATAGRHHQASRGAHRRLSRRRKSVEFFEALPRNASGKILRRELREPYWAGKSRRVN
jgi:acyl-coenzyme A synthetase/AMP-(fatty) acid ligase